MPLSLDKPKGKKSLIRFGPIIRSDPRAEWRLFEYDGEDPPHLHSMGPIADKKKIEVALPEGGRYIVMVIGDKVAGIETTAKQELSAPFNLFIDAPEDHSKDFLRLSIPTNVPVTGDRLAMMDPLRKEVKKNLRKI